MHTVFYTLQDFMTHAEGITYLLIAGALCFFGFFWSFLSERDD
jgi:hypothetical protein